ncbi:MAG: MerR family transcriptional regulator [Planctomycetota bacterium]|jgi:predicted RNase H-like HicB family nuclease
MSVIDLTTESFNAGQAQLLTGVSKRQVVHWDQRGIVKPSVSPASGRGSRRLYSYKDLLALMTVKSLKAGGFSLQKIGRCVSYLRRRLPDVSQPLSFCRLIACGDTLFLALDEETYIDTLRSPGQTAHRSIVDIGMFDHELRDRIVVLAAKRVEQVSVGDYTYQVEVEPDPDDGGYVATVAGLPGCITDGDTLEETVKNAEDAIEAWLEAHDELRRSGVRVPLSQRRKRRRRTG